MDFKKIFKLENVKDKIKNKSNNEANIKKDKEIVKGKIGKNKIGNLLILILVGVLLLMVSNVFKDSSMGKNDNNMKKLGKAVFEQNKINDENTNVMDKEKTDSQNEMENKLKNILENIEDVGKVEVMLYFKGGEEQIPAINVNDSTSFMEEKDNDGGIRKTTQKNDGRTVVMMNTENGTKPLIVKKYNPEVTGVCIVAEGAENNLIKLQIHKAVMNLFDLEDDKVNVYPMKK
ncbi:stage III sporulation protein AG [Clostridium aestuarii]|uniref:Stage III sporulation protein AG n=1 Tax=Clostridium aestuarii TaxID=338193 RepID=A0ABT4D069_9CLOT|nr:stage III sporulation protein AG [Clostridium aestuarii]MCY6483755.1 stage III sporulation protein AG [Clostridium aestuarii]